ncbi:MAG TPA: adenylate/guanylate cyclase domain-containing protein [Actinomycetota bacterium]|nr:adenylate/guanylate cyclase domain-containing protein [Actinomycetota bacterium]
MSATQPLSRDELLEGLRAGLGQSDWSVEDLWMHFRLAGGTGSIATIRNWLRGTHEPRASEYGVVAHVLNERLAALGRDHRVATFGVGMAAVPAVAAAPATVAAPSVTPPPVAPPPPEPVAPAATPTPVAPTTPPPVAPPPIATPVATPPIPPPVAPPPVTPTPPASPPRPVAPPVAPPPEPKPVRPPPTPASTPRTPVAADLPDEPVTEARKVVTLVFCDLTGSTALGDKMDPEALRRLITRYFEESKQVLSRHGGTIEKFIGDAVVAVFGIPFVREDDALRAVTAADELQHHMEAMNREIEVEWGARLEARIGVNTGEVLAGDATGGHGFMSGDAVNVAARLEQNAPPGEVLMGESTYRLVRDAVEVEVIEGIELKGKGAVKAYKLVRVIPHALGISRRLDSILVGRDEELGQMQRTLDQAINERACKLLTVFGTAGLGKSRLTAELLAGLDGKAQVLHGRCLPYGEGITFWPIAEAVRSFLSITEEVTRDEARHKIEELMASHEEGDLVAKGLCAALGFVDEAITPQEAFWAVRRMLEHVGADGPVLFVIDDLHWAEQPLLDLIEYVAAFSQGTQILLLCLARRDILELRPQWGALGVTIGLAPLPNEQVEQLMRNLLGDAELPGDVRRKIIAAAEGNPLYVEEIVRMLVDDKALVPKDAGWATAGDLSSLAVPPTIQALVAARLDKLDEDEYSVLQRSSVIGKTFWWGAVHELSPEDQRQQVGMWLQALMRKELVQPDRSNFVGEDAFKFAHVVTRDTAYAGMPKGVRSHLHARFAGWLEFKSGDRMQEFEEILGYHLEQSYRLQEELGSIDETGLAMGASAAQHLFAAGMRALNRGDMHAAANLLGRTRELLDEREPRRLELTMDLSDALVDLGEFDRAAAILEEAERVAGEVGYEEVESRAALQRVWLRVSTEAEGARGEARRRAEELMPKFTNANDHFGLARAFYLLAFLEWEAYSFTAVDVLLEHALEHARQTDSRSNEARILQSMSASLMWGPTPASKAEERCRELLELAQGNRVLEPSLWVRTGVLLAMQGDFDQARDLVERSRSIWKEFGQDLALAWSAQDAGIIELLADDLDAAERGLRAGCAALSEMGNKPYLATTSAMLARVLVYQERWDEAETATIESEEAAGDDPHLTGEWGPTRARVHAHRGLLDQAEELARRAVDVLSVHDIFSRGYALTSLAEVLLTAGKGAEADAFIEQALHQYERKEIAPFIAKMKGWQEKLAS